MKIEREKYWSDYALRYFSASSRDFYSKVLAPIYLKQKDTAKAALCILRSAQTIKQSIFSEGTTGLGFNMPVFWQTSLHSSHLKQILRWKASLRESDYLEFLTAEINKKNTTNIIHLLGTVYLREHKYEAAVNAFKKIDNAKLEKVAVLAFDTHTQYADPFTDQLHDYPRIYTTKVKGHYTQLDYAKEMSLLKEKIKTDPKNAARYYYKMANGLYNTSYYGNAWYFTSFDRYTLEDKQTGGHYYDCDYLNEHTAERYFIKARQLSSNLEFKARCTFMAAKCRQKRVVYPPYPDYWSNRNVFDQQYKRYDHLVDLYDQRIRKNVYFTDLKLNYSKTKFYKIAVEECSYFRDFINPHAMSKSGKLKVVINEN